MTRPTTYTRSGAKNFVDSMWDFYTELEAKFGRTFAQEFLLKFYEGAGRNE